MLHRLLLFIIAGYYKILSKTVRFEVLGLEEARAEVQNGLSPVFASAHTALLPCLLSYKEGPLTALVSRSKDGELIAHALERFGYRTIRGSSNRGSVASLQQLLTATKAGEPIAIAFDGPKGPPLVAKQGILLSAKRATGSLYFVSAKPLKTCGLRFWVRFKSWDRFLLLFPFARVEVCYEKITTGVDKTDREFLSCAKVELERQARTAYGALYD